jgi:hypothetical protein
MAALVPSRALFQQRLCFATGLAFLYHFALVILLHTLGSNASGLTAVALSALLAGLMLAVPSAKVDAAPTASDAPLHHHLRSTFQFCAAGHVLFRGIVIMRLVSVVVIVFC